MTVHSAEDTKNQATNQPISDVTDWQSFRRFTSLAHLFFAARAPLSLAGLIAYYDCYSRIMSRDRQTPANQSSKHARDDCVKCSQLPQVTANEAFAIVRAG